MVFIVDSRESTARGIWESPDWKWSAEKAGSWEEIRQKARGRGREVEARGVKDQEESNYSEYLIWLSYKNGKLVEGKWCSGAREV